MKYRPDPTGPWKTVSLGKHPEPYPPSRPPKKPPQFILDRAREFAEIEYRAQHGLQGAPARAKDLTVYLDAYLEAYAGTRRRGSVKQIRRHVRTFLEFARVRGITTVQAVTRAVCRDYLEERIKHVAHTTLRTERGFLIAIWTRAVEDELVMANPWTYAKVPGKPIKRAPTFWSADEIRAIAHHCHRPWQRDLVLLLANTGLRVSTALAMQWGWIEGKRGTVRIPARERIKTSYVHILNDPARVILQRRALEVPSGKDDLVFPNPLREGVVPYDSARAAIDRAITKAGVKPGHVHDLRHSYGRALAAAGVPLNVIQAQLGHTTLTMTGIYSTADLDTVAGAVAGWGIPDAV
jgi:integrase